MVKHARACLCQKSCWNFLVTMRCARRSAEKRCAERRKGHSKRFDRIPQKATAPSGVIGRVGASAVRAARRRRRRPERTALFHSIGDALALIGGCCSRFRTGRGGRIIRRPFPRKIISKVSYWQAWAALGVHTLSGSSESNTTRRVKFAAPFVAASPMSYLLAAEGQTLYQPALLPLIRHSSNCNTCLIINL